MTDPGDTRDGPRDERETGPAGDGETDAGNEQRGPQLESGTGKRADSGGTGEFQGGPATEDGESSGGQVSVGEQRPAGRRVDPPPNRRGDDGDESGPSGWQLFAWDLTTSILAVALFGAFLFAISGVWPPMVAIESGSMEPNMNEDDLVFVMDADRFPPAESTGGTGVVTAERGAETGYAEYGAPGDVIIFEPDGRSDDTPIIHRAMLWVDEGENWYDRADSDYIQNANSCNELRNCPSPHDGYITKGDNNGAYDQARGLSEPVQSEWVVGTAEVRIPRLGWFRLQFQ